MRAEGVIGPRTLPGRVDLPAAGAEVHLMGAGGAGMRGLAVLLADGGWRVSGCDRRPGLSVPEIEASGGRCRPGHDPAHLEGVALLVRSAAVPVDHPEVEAAAGRNVPVWKRARALGALVNGRRLVAVTGTHGKTTITAMATLCAEAAGLDPTGVTGGRVDRWGGHARIGTGRTAIVEADEFDGAFLWLDPRLAVVSAVEPEHLESYDGLEGLEAAFRAFADRAAGREGVLACADDTGARSLARTVPGARTYGFREGADFRVESLRPVRRHAPGTGAATGVVDPGLARLEFPEGELEFELDAPGRHNLQNAAGALAVALTLGADPDPLRGALVGFEGVERRLERLWEGARAVVIDDYAHHPTEVEAAIAAVRELYPGWRLEVVFQPHLFTRTRDFAEEFGRALGDADVAWVLPIFPSREEPIPGVSSELVVEAGGAGVRGLGKEGALRRVVESAVPGEPAGAARGETPGRPAGPEAGAADASDGRRESGSAGREPDSPPASGRRGRERLVWLFLGAGDVTDLARRAAEEASRVA